MPRTARDRLAHEIYLTEERWRHISEEHPEMTMKPIRITYDPEGDILYITFGQPVSATGYQLSDQVLLRIDPQTSEAAGLTILNYSIHACGEQDIPLPGLEEEDPEIRARLMSVLASPPVSHFIRATEEEHGVRASLLSPSLREAMTA
jgi:uncharacterized protein YuzE